MCCADTAGIAGADEGRCASAFSWLSLLPLLLPLLCAFIRSSIQIAYDLANKLLHTDFTSAFRNPLCSHFRCQFVRIVIKLNTRHDSILLLVCSRHAIRFCCFFALVTGPRKPQGPRRPQALFQVTSSRHFLRNFSKTLFRVTVLGHFFKHFFQHSFRTFFSSTFPRHFFKTLFQALIQVTFQALVQATFSRHFFGSLFQAIFQALFQISSTF